MILHTIMSNRNNKKPVCGVCDKTIPKSVYKISCSVCKKWHHSQCAGLSELEIRIMSEQKKCWNCNECNVDVRKRQSLGHSTSSGLLNQTLGGSPKTGKSDSNDTTLFALVVEV